MSQPLNHESFGGTGICANGESVQYGDFPHATMSVDDREKPSSLAETAVPGYGCPMVFLINRISGIGHLDAYARLYARALLELGCRVALIAENVSSVAPYLDRSSPGTRSRFTAYTPREIVSSERNRSDAPRAHLPIHRRARAVWREEGATGVFRRVLILSARLANLLLPECVALWLANALYRMAPGLVAFVWTPNQVDIARWTGLARLLEKEMGREADLIVHLYLDGMDDGAETLKVFDGEKRPWIGILFHPRSTANRSATPERYFAASSARGGIVLVPSALPIYREAFPRLHFALVPDVADLELSHEISPLGQLIRARAGGRKVVLLAGTVSPHKGITDLIDVISLADPTQFFFAIVGVVLWQKFGLDEPKVRKFYASPRENVFVHDGYIPDERSYNSIIASSDIIFAVYRGFNDSSNSLAKAAGLKRPVLAAAGTLMGRRVESAKIGAVAPEGDPEGILEILKELVSRPLDTFDFAHYAREHSFDALKKELSIALPNWLAPIKREPQ